MAENPSSTIGRVMHTRAYTISQVSKALGVHPDSIRRWEKKGKIAVRRNSINNHRIFFKEDVKTIYRLIRGAKDERMDKAT